VVQRHAQAELEGRKRTGQERVHRAPTSRDCPRTRGRKRSSSRRGPSGARPSAARGRGGLRAALLRDSTALSGTDAQDADAPDMEGFGAGREGVSAFLGDRTEASEGGQAAGGDCGRSTSSLEVDCANVGADSPSSCCGCGRRRGSPRVSAEQRQNNAGINTPVRGQTRPAALDRRRRNGESTAHASSTTPRLHGGRSNRTSSKTLNSPSA
jgi:hypothetical protein